MRIICKTNPRGLYSRNSSTLSVLIGSLAGLHISYLVNVEHVTRNKRNDFGLEKVLATVVPVFY